MAFPTTPVIDDFNRADTGPPPSASWTTYSTYAGHKVVSNQLQASANNSWSHYTAQDFGPDCEVFVTCVTASPGAFMPTLRATDIGGVGTEDSYIFYIATGTGGIYRDDNEVSTLLGSTFSCSLTTNDQVGLSAVGTTLSAYKNGVLLSTSSDTTYQSAGKIGLYNQISGDTSDDFGGGTIQSAVGWPASEKLGFPGSARTTMPMFRGPRTDRIMAMREGIGSAGRRVIDAELKQEVRLNQDPVASISTTVSAPAATATASASAPIPQVTLPPGAATATASASAPIQQVTLLPAAATASASASAPSFVNSPTVSAPAASATASAQTPVPQITLLPAAATETASAQAPGIAITILPPAATATASGALPTPKITLAPAAATATAQAVAPSLAISPTISPSAATATASASAPSIAIGPLLSSPVATSTASAFAPTLVIVQNVLVIAVPATGQVIAVAPTIDFTHSGGPYAVANPTRGYWTVAGAGTPSPSKRELVGTAGSP